MCRLVIFFARSLLKANLAVLDEASNLTCRDTRGFRAAAFIEADLRAIV